MKYTFAILATTAAVSIAASAHAADESAKSNADIDYKDNGGYEAKLTSESKAADGTARTAEVTEDVNINDDGSGSRTTEKVTTTDPKGLMNKSKETTTVEVDQDEKGGFEKTTTTKSTDADGTDITNKVTTEVKVNDDGTTSAETTTKKVVDPKGLMNKTTTETKTKAGASY